MLNQQLVAEAEELKQDGHSLELLEDGTWSVLVIHAYPVPPGYSKSSTDLLVKVPASYPNGGPDMFWVDEDLRLANSQVPKRADAVESLLGKAWRRFSWHPQGWTPASCNIRTFLEFINSRLAKKE